MSTENENLVEIEILTPEQINLLPEEVKENVVYLTENANIKDLKVLNPIVSKLLKIKTESLNLKLIPKDEEGNFNKENIKEYKSLKSSIGSFNTSLRDSATELKRELKKPYAALLDIEKVFKNISSQISENIKNTFSEYEEAEAEKKRIAKEKKDAILNAKVAEAEAEAEKAKLVNKKAETYNAIKYEKIAEGIVSKTTNLINSANELELQKQLDFLQNKINFGDLIFGYDLSILDMNVQTELRQYFASSVHNSKTLLEGKLEALKNQKQLDIQEAISNPKNTVEQIREVEKQVDEIIEKSPLPPPPSFNQVEVYTEEFRSLNDSEFKSYIEKEKRKLKMLIEARIKIQGPSKYLIDLLNEPFTNN